MVDHPVVKRLLDVDTEIVPGVDHLGRLEDPLAVAASVRRFIADA